MRYAVYYAPKAGSPLDRFARTWLGRDAETGTDVEQPALSNVPPERLTEITRSPRHYGFHATLKPPFPLAPGRSEDALRSAVAAFAGNRQSFTAPSLILRSIDGFLALTLSEPCPAIDRLAADCVEAFDAFRRPPDAAELGARRSRRLTPCQDRLLMQWGYPYVFEEFRFHMTLTERLAPEERILVETALAPLVEPFSDMPLTVDGIALFHQPDRASPFLLLGRFPFGG